MRRSQVGRAAKNWVRIGLMMQVRQVCSKHINTHTKPHARVVSLQRDGKHGTFVFERGLTADVTTLWCTVEVASIIPSTRDILWLEWMEWTVGIVGGEYCD